jgi:hypothetical protein
MQLLGVICDNAKNNSTMIDELEKLLEQSMGSGVHVRCFAHTLNFIVKVNSFFTLSHSRPDTIYPRQAILCQFSCTLKVSDDNSDDEAALQEIDEPADEEDEAAQEQEDADREASDETVLDSFESELVAEGGHEVPELTQADINLGRFSVHKESKDGFIFILYSSIG